MSERGQVTVTGIRSRRRRWILVALAALAMPATVMFGLRSYHSFLLLRSAYEAGAPKASSIRPWMTLAYVADTYGAPEPALSERLGLPPESNRDASLKSLAKEKGLSPFRYVQRVQAALAEVVPNIGADAEPQETGWFVALSDRVLAAVLVYGYPALGLTFVLGSLGLPVPTGLSTVVAGSMAAQGHIDWAWGATFVVTAQIVGDLSAYGVARGLGRELLERRGRWFGYTPARRRRVDLLFERWGLLTVLLSRTLVSGLSAVANLAAGASGYRLRSFVAFAVVGRLIWTAAYFGLGYAVGGDIEPAENFLMSVSFLLISLAVLLGSGLVALKQPRTDGLSTW